MTAQASKLSTGGGSPSATASGAVSICSSTPFTPVWVATTRTILSVPPIVPAKTSITSAARVP